MASHHLIFLSSIFPYQLLAMIWRPAPASPLSYLRSFHLDIAHICVVL